MKSQIRFVPNCKKSLIAQAILAKLDTIPRIKYKSFDRVRLTSDDFNEVTTPAVQLIDLRTTNQHEQSRVKRTWLIALELVMKGTQWEPVSQQDLWNLTYQVERALWAEPNLNVPGVIHLKAVGDQTDLHLIDPYYFARLEFEVLYYEPLTRNNC